MAVNKVVYNGTTLIDLTEDTITNKSLMTDTTALGADGSKLTSADPVVVMQMNSRTADMYIPNAIGHVEGRTLILLKKSPMSDSNFEIEQETNNSDNESNSEEENNGDN